MGVVIGPATKEKESRTLKFLPDHPWRAGMERLTLTTGEVMVEVSKLMTARALAAVNCIFYCFDGVSECTCWYGSKVCRIVR